MKKVLIAPSILSADFSNMGIEIERMENFGADLMHCDVMDGVFVPNITFGPKMIADIKKCASKPLDVHLMIVEPERYVKNFISAGADYLTIHYEATKKLLPTLEIIKNSNCKSGVVISPDTDVKVLAESLAYSDMVLLMSVYPGFGGQKFIEKSLDRLKELAELAAKFNPNCLIEIDGGITLDNIESVISAGANVIVAGNTIFGAADPKATIEKLRCGK